MFDPARLNIEREYRFGRPVVPRERFLVPLSIINEVVDRIMDGSIVHYVDDPATSVVPHSRRVQLTRAR